MTFFIFPSRPASTVGASNADNVPLSRWPFTSFPVVDKNKKMLGLITRDRLEFIEGSTNPPLSEVMIPIAELVTAPADTNTDKAYDIMSQKRVKKLPVLDNDGVLQGLYVWYVFSS